MAQTYDDPPFIIPRHLLFRVGSVRMPFINPCHLLFRIVPSGLLTDATASIYTNGNLSGNGDSVHDSSLISIIVNRIVLRRTVIPDRNISYRPLPANRVFQTRDVILKE
jgi:hypothetical protein